MISTHPVADRVISLVKGAIFVALVIPLFAACQFAGVKPVESAPSVYDRVMQQGKIRCGYVVYDPGCLKDPNSGRLSGIGVEALERVADKLGLKVEWTEEVGWGSMIEGLQTNRYDIIATPIWTNANRAKIVDFSTPLFFSPIYVYVKSGDKRLNAKNLNSLNSAQFSIATVDGETAEIIAREDFPKAKTVSLPQLSDISQLLLTVSSGKADVAFSEPAVVAAFIKNNPQTIQIVATERPLRVFANCWMFRRGQMEFKNMLDTVLGQLANSGELDQIIGRYESTKGSLLRIALPYQPLMGNTP